MFKWKVIFGHPSLAFASILIGIPGYISSIQEWPHYVRAFLSLSVLGMNVFGTISVILLTAHLTSVAWNNGYPYRRWWQSTKINLRRFAASWKAQPAPAPWSELCALPDIAIRRALQIVNVEPFHLDSIRELKAELTKLDSGQPSPPRKIGDAVLYSLDGLLLATLNDPEEFRSLPPLSFLTLVLPAHGGWMLSVGSGRLDPMDQAIYVVFLEDEPGSGTVTRVAYAAYGHGPLIHSSLLTLESR